MAIAPKDMYPGQIATGDTNYPAGKAQNVVVAGDGIGTPWEKTLVNEHFGFQQALLRAASLTENGVPESVAASQYLAAIQALIAAVATPISDRVATLEAACRRPGFYTAATQSTPNGALIAWTESDDPTAAYSLSSDKKQLIFTRNGRFWIQPTLNYNGIAGASGQVGFYIRRDTLVFAKAADYWSYDSGQDTATVTARALVKITDYTTQRVNIQIASDDNTSTGISSAYMSVETAY